jgi:hypothetical protein
MPFMLLFCSNPAADRKRMSRWALAAIRLPAVLKAIRCAGISNCDKEKIHG